MDHSAVADAIADVSESVALFEDAEQQDRFLSDVIKRIADAVGALTAALFFLDPESGELVFRAGVDSEGLWDRMRCGRSASELRFPLDGNDVGLAFQNTQIVRKTYTIDDEPVSKVIVPIARGPVRIGVLVFARVSSEAFPEVSDAEMLAAAARLGDAVLDASVLIETARQPVDSGRRPAQSGPRTIRGRRASEGTVAGRALPFWSDLDSAADAAGDTADPEEETRRFDAALERSVHQLDELQNIDDVAVAEAGLLIFAAHLMMVKDTQFTGRMRSRVGAGESAVDAIRGVVEEYAARFSEMTEVRLAEKAQDVRDLGYRLITNLTAEDEHSFSYAGRIVLTRHIYPSDLYRLSVEGVSGLVLLGSGVTAHISILARSLDLPVLITDDPSILEIESGTPLVLRSTDGRLDVEPPTEVYREVLRIASGGAVTERPVSTRSGRTSDGVAVHVRANVNILKDADDAVLFGSEGIGLYRSEFPFILKNDFLSEEQQYTIYRSVVESHAGKPVDLRTADIGGDKLLQGRGDAEENPFLGVRGIRFSLANREMFRDQLRAMLRAGAGADLGIMLPMVSTVEEVIEAKTEISRAIENLARRGEDHNAAPRVGAMVELPSAALSVRDLAAEVDFLSIGTNDLTMYLLAVDRTNEHLSHLYSSYHPTVLSTIASIAEAAGELRPHLSVCGDAAADPVLIPFFVGVGIRTLSVSPGNINVVKERLSALTVPEAEQIAKQMLSLRRISEMEAFISGFDSA